MPTMSTALPDFSLPQAWPFAGLDAGLGWAERLVAGSLASQRGAAHASSVLPGSQELTPTRAASGTASLTAALAGIVVIAAQRALAAGDLPKLREAIDRAFDSVLSEAEARDPREDGMGELPRIADAEPTSEAGRLRHLMRRQSIL
jgi:hypothetical protein